MAIRTCDLTVRKSFLLTPNLTPDPSSLTTNPSLQLKIISDLFFMCLEIVGRGNKELQKTTFEMQICYLGKSWASLVFWYHSSRKHAFEWMRLDWGREREAARKSDRKMEPCFSECGAGPRAWEPPGRLLEIENLGLHPRPTERIRTCHLTRPLGNSCKGFNLRNTALGQRQKLQGIIPGRVQVLGALTAGRPQVLEVRERLGEWEGKLRWGKKVLKGNNDNCDC